MTSFPSCGKLVGVVPNRVISFVNGFGGALLVFVPIGDGQYLLFCNFINLTDFLS